MSNAIKNQKEILNKLGIEKLNPMQEEAGLAVHSAAEVVLLSPTGTGKTLAFLLPLVESLNPEIPEVQALIIAPSRELAIQIESVLREMGTGFKTNAVYGGTSFSKDKTDLKHRPAVLVGTPGRIADHLRRGTFSTEEIKTLILDEFDKSLEVGFEGEMMEIVDALPYLKKKVLTSATQGIRIPEFIGIKEPVYVNHLKEGSSQLEIRTVISPEKDKLKTLLKLLSHVGNEPGIIFCNYKETINYVSEFLDNNGISHGAFYGGMEQRDRERSLIKFRNGSYQILLATDLAARGIDVPEMKFIIHYHLPKRSEEFTHRNGRTARMNSEGTAYVLKWEGEPNPDFISNIPKIELKNGPLPESSKWRTLFISGGKKDKISKGDIVGVLFKQVGLEKDQLGIIELKQDCAFVSISKDRIKDAISILDNTKLKSKKVRVTVV